MSKVGSIALNTYRETVRDKVLYNLVLFALLMIGSSYILGQISVHQDVKIMKDLGLAAIAVFGLVIAIFIGIGLVSKEIDKRTLYSLLAKPVSRTQFLMGKYFGLCLTLAVNVTVMAFGLYALLYLMAGELDFALLKAIYLIYFELALTTALALLFSTFTSSVLSGISTGFLWAAGHFLADVRNFESVLESEWLPRVTTFLYYLLPNFRNFDVKARVVSGDPVPFSLLGFSTLYGAIYIALLLVGAAAILSRRNLK